MRLVVPFPVGRRDATDNQARQPVFEDMFVWPRLSVRVDEDIFDLQVVAEQSARVVGRIIDDQGRPLPLAFGGRGPSVQLSAQLVKGIFLGPQLRGVASGEFLLDTVADSYQVRVSNVPDGWAVQAIHVDGTELTNDVVELLPAGRYQLDLVLTNQVGRVTGTVMDRADRPASQARVLLFPTQTFNRIGLLGITRAHLGLRLAACGQRPHADASTGNSSRWRYGVNMAS